MRDRSIARLLAGPLSPVGALTAPQGGGTIGRRLFEPGLFGVSRNKTCSDKSPPPRKRSFFADVWPEKKPKGTPARRGTNSPSAADPALPSSAAATARDFPLDAAAHLSPRPNGFFGHRAFARLKSHKGLFLPASQIRHGAMGRGTGERERRQAKKRFRCFTAQGAEK